MKDGQHSVIIANISFERNIITGGSIIYHRAQEKVEKQIALLREYRTCLISDVVTGQIDVQDEVIPDYTPETDTEDEDAATAESEAD